MTDRPIIFGVPMVRAILDGRKTVTRRLVKDATGAFWDHTGYRPSVADGRVRWHCVDTGAEVGPGSPMPWSPYGGAGDRLWVREKWKPRPAPFDSESFSNGVYFAADWGPKGYPVHPREEHADDIRRLAGRRVAEFHRPSSMPRWASRITLDVVSVQVERLQAITDEDARAEGVREMPLQEGQAGAWWTADPSASLAAPDPVSAFRKLWDSLNAKRAPWDSDPWVWRVEFRRAVTP